MNTRRIAIGALALASTFCIGSAANAQVEYVEPSTVIVEPDVNTVEVIPQQTTEVTQVITQPAVFEPVFKHEMIRTVPTSPTVRTLPVVIERTTESTVMDAPTTFMPTTIIEAPAVVAPSTVVVPSATVIETPTFITSPQVVAPIETTTTVTKSISFDPLSLSDTVLGLNHMDRLTDMMDQVALGQSNGSLTTDAVTSLHAERDRIRDLINSHSPGGMTTDEINSVELALNELNQRIAHEMSGMVRPIASFGSPL